MRRIYLLCICICSIVSGGVYAADTVIGSTYLDNNSDGQIETVTITFDEGITCSAGGANGFSVTTAGTINVSSVDSVSCNGSALVVLTVTADPNKTGGSTAPVFAYSDAGGDLAGIGQITDKAGLSPGDSANPRLSTVTLNSASATVIQGENFTLTFTATESLVATPSVDVDDASAGDISCGAVTDTSGGSDRTAWSATCAATDGNVNGEITFTIDADDDALNSMNQVTATTNSSSITIQKYGSGGGSGGSIQGSEVTTTNAEVASEDEEVSSEDEVVEQSNEEVIQENEVTETIDSSTTTDDQPSSDETIKEVEEVIEDIVDGKELVVLDDESVLGLHSFLVFMGILKPANDCEQAECSRPALRQEVLGIALRLGGHDILPRDQFTDFFGDVDYEDDTSWVAGVVETALSLGIISDDNEFFRPTEDITRAEAYAILMSATCVDMMTESDDWQSNVYQSAAYYGFTTRSETEFEANSPVIRQDLFAMSARMLVYVNNEGGCE